VLNVGLTGGIGAGKSEVTRRLGERGAFVIDADAIAREVVARGTPGLDAVVAEFGRQMLAGDGSLDRDQLAAVVFADSAARERLNAIVHPLVAARVVELLAELESRAPEAIVVHDVPLIAEAGIRDRYDLVVVVDAPPETQLDRLIRLRGMTEADARARIAAQAGREDRLAIADRIIVNDGDLDVLDQQVSSLWAALGAASTR
jgi:dephospho-CoA kinase